MLRVRVPCGPCGTCFPCAPFVPCVLCRPCGPCVPCVLCDPFVLYCPLLLVSHVSPVSTVAFVAPVSPFVPWGPCVPCVHCYLCDPFGFCGHRGNRTCGKVTCTLDPPLDPFPLSKFVEAHIPTHSNLLSLSYKFAAFFAFSPFMSSFARFVIHTVFVILLVSFCQNFFWIIFLLKRTAIQNKSVTRLRKLGTRCLATRGVTQSEHLLEGLS